MRFSNKLYRNLFIGFWALFLSAFLLVFLVFASINLGWIGYLPPLDELQNPKNNYATEIFSSDMEVLGRFFYGSESRVGVLYSEISPSVIDALVATEDVRFYKHSGIDGKALLRAIIFTGILRNKSAGGGSTITQQLAKQLYSPTTRDFKERMFQKPIEWVIAVELEKLYTKEELIAMYLNQFDFLYNAVGIKSAAMVYFGKNADELTVEESATLIGMCKNPSAYNPKRHLERSKNRRNTVLAQMQKAEFLTTAECDSLQALPLELNFKRITHNTGIARYFREHLRVFLTASLPERKNYGAWQEQKYKDDLWEWENNPLYGFCNKNKKSDGTPYNIYSDGLKIYTTIDSRMQRYAEEAADEHIQVLQADFNKEKKGTRNGPFSSELSQLEIENIMKRSTVQSDRYRKMKKNGIPEDLIMKAFNSPVDMTVFSYKGDIDTTMTPLDSIRYYKYFLACGLMSADARNGHVKAYVGGTNYNYFKYDMAGQGRRQVGSTVKPFLYTLAMEEGMNPCDETINEPYTIMENGRPWTPRNASSDRIGETVTLRWGLANSNNWISTYLIDKFTPQALVNLMHSFGISGHLDPVPAIVLGSCDVSVKEMVGAYTAFPNKGIRTEPLYITHIEDSHGNTIRRFVPRQSEVFSETTSYKMISMLKNVIEHGTGRRLRFRYGLYMPAGGKTGTTQNQSDGWFIGFTPKLVSGVWVGADDPSIHFDGIRLGQGANTALPVWGLYMQKVFKDSDLEYRPSDDFDIPSNYNPNMGCPLNEF